MKKSLKGFDNGDDMSNMNSMTDTQTTKKVYPNHQTQVLHLTERCASGSRKGISNSVGAFKPMVMNAATLAKVLSGAATMKGWTVCGRCSK